MSAINQTLRDELCESNRAVEYYLRGRYGMTLKLFKLVKALTQLVAVSAGMGAMYLGADPLFTFVGVVLLVTGPEGVEYWMSQAGAMEPQNVSELDQAIEEADISAQDIVDQLDGEDGS